MSVADSGLTHGHSGPMLSSAALLTALRRLKDQGKTTNADIGRLLSLPSSRIAEMFKGERAIKIDEMKVLVDHFELDGPRPPSAANDDDVAEVQSLDLAFSFGPGTNIDDYIESSPLKFDLSYIRGFTRTATDRLRIARGVGESMFPTLVSSDLVWIDTTQTMLNQQDRIWAVSLFGAAAIKRLRTIGKGKVLVISDNPAVENQEVRADDLIIGGRVIRLGRDL